MPADPKQSYDLPPNIQLTAPASRLQPKDPGDISEASLDTLPRRGSGRTSHPKERSEKHVRVADPSPRRWSSGSNIYLGSYGRSAYRSRVSLEGSSGARTPHSSIPPSPRASISHAQLEHLLQNVEVELESYGVEELRDGFFDASFYRPSTQENLDLLKAAAETLPQSFRTQSLSVGVILKKQWQQVTSLLCRSATTESGLKLAKSFLGFFIAYIICLIPIASDWLGRYSYIIALSTIINHSGRSLGSQIDGAILTTLGTAAGLGWGSLALYVSTSTSAARSGYGGALATFLVILTASLAWLRCIFMRFYQAVICAGIAICYSCLADTSHVVGWKKIFDYGIPWILGQAIGLVVCVLLFPDTGSRSLAAALHGSLLVVNEALLLPRADNVSTKRDLAWNFVNLSQAVRDFTIDLAVSRFRPEDVRSLRNLIQGVLRSTMAIRPNTTLLGASRNLSNNDIPGGESIIDMETSELGHLDIKRIPSSVEAMRLVTTVLAGPTAALIESMKEAVSSGDAILMKLSGSREDPILDHTTRSDLPQILQQLRKRMAAFDEADLSLIDHPKLPSTYSDHPEVVELFLFVHPVRQTADRVEAFLVKVMEIQGKRRGLRILLPSYPFTKSLFRTNAQVRHDRGGLTAGSYFRTKGQLEKTMRDLQSTAYIPLPRHHMTETLESPKHPTTGKYHNGQQVGIDTDQWRPESITIRYRIWILLHRLQGFETRFAFKVVLVTTLLSIPAWLSQSHQWWNSDESWWAVVAVWDLATRALCAVLGSVWGGLAYAAGNGSPYVMAVFAAIFMIPMIYRSTQSSHPRSGLIGCISFTIISLSTYKQQGRPTPVHIAWTRGLAFVVGVVAAVVVNWVLWPFVARHELRKSVATMMLHAAILYRGMVAKYIYFSDGEGPKAQDLERSEMLEGRL
ncbi:MAG: hypothetical protein M1830_002692, partial [Pleopsidium flavum]